MSGEGDALRPPQVRGGLRRLQDLCQAPTFSCREFSNIQTHVALLWLLRLSVLDYEVELKYTMLFATRH